MIPTVRLNGGLGAPQLGLGTWQMRGRECSRAVERALELGYRHIDTAEGYGNEADVGAAIAGAGRDELFLVSKVWRDNLRPDDLLGACEGSLRRLGTDRLDLLLIHWPNRDIPLERTIDAFRRLVAERMIGGWGVSNFTAAHAREAARLGEPATNQVELHPYFNQFELERECAALGIPLTAYSPLAKGRVADDPVLQRIAAAHDATAAQVALAWIARRGVVVIPKARGERHLRENMRALSIELSDAEASRIDALEQGPRLVDGDWSEFDRDG